MDSKVKDPLLGPVSEDEECESTDIIRSPKGDSTCVHGLSHPPCTSRIHRRVWSIALGIFMTSLTLNLLLLSYIATQKLGTEQPVGEGSAISPYIGLSRSLSKEIPFRSPYWDDNETLADQLWNEIPTSSGFVVLDKDWTDAKELPRGDSFPWDESKTIYMLNAYHILHCLKMFHVSITESHHGRPQTMLYGHLQHCLNDLREDTICNADDTPRYTRPEPNRITGADGQQRTCRDFAALEQWAHKHTACFTFAHGDDPAWNRTARLRFCPPDSPATDLECVPKMKFSATSYRKLPPSSTVLSPIVVTPALTPRKAERPGGREDPDLLPGMRCKAAVWESWLGG